MEVPFESDHVGKCNDCGTIDTLDSMVRKDQQKGVYHCKDCEAEDDFSKYFNNEESGELQIINKTKLQKLMTWCFG